MRTLTPEELAKRIALLADFRKKLKTWDHLSSAIAAENMADLAASLRTDGRVPSRGTGAYVVTEPEMQRDEARSFVNRKLVEVHAYVRDAGLAPVLWTPAPGVESIDPFTARLFDTFKHKSPVAFVLDVCEQAIGVYEAMQSGVTIPGAAPPDALDAIDAITRGLRPFFDDPPKNEKAVQKVVEAILSSLAVRFTREKEPATIGDKNFIPDFVLTDFSLALEIKLATETHSPAKVQEEIAADVAAYATKWKHLVFLVYDCGQIAAPERFADAHRNHFGVRVHIVKH